MSTLRTSPRMEVPLFVTNTIFSSFFSVDHDHLDHLPRQVVKEDFGFIGQPQKRGAVQPLGLSASSVTITKKPRKTAETKSDAKQKWIAQQQQVIFL